MNEIVNENMSKKSCKIKVVNVLNKSSEQNILTKVMNKRKTLTTLLFSTLNKKKNKIIPSQPPFHQTSNLVPIDPGN